MMKSQRFTVFAGGVLVYNLLVILWGAFVRATGSGAGCGNHWPMCNGEVIPRAPQLDTLIEFSHRITSGIAGFLVLGLFIWAFRLFAKGHPARLGATISLVFITIEALVGAFIVRFGFVGDDSSVYRAIIIAIHLVNTFILVAGLVLTVWWSAGHPRMQLRGNGLIAWLLGVAVFGALLVGASGAITALGDTLFPATSLREGLRQDFAADSHFLLRLRVLHPVLAITLGLYLVVAARIASRLRSTTTTRSFARVLAVLFVVQLMVGMLNVRLLAPVWMQLIHLLLADLVWIALILVAASALAERSPQAVPVEASPSVSPHRAMPTTTSPTMAEQLSAD